MTLTTVLMIVLPILGLIFGWLIRWLYARFQLSSTEQTATRIKDEALKDAEAKKRELLLETKDQLIYERNQQEKEFRERRNELQKLDSRLLQKEEALEKKSVSLEKFKSELENRGREIAKKEAKTREIELEFRKELERISNLTAEEAKALIIKNMENEAKHDAQALINKIEQESHITAEKKAREFLVSVMERIVRDVTPEVTISTVALPNDDMKGRIIGREGRNIRTLETLTGVDIVVDDTPEVVVISCFDSIRREVAKTALERLVYDGRIHPARIEEVVHKVVGEVKRKIFDEGEKVLFDLGIHNIPKEGIRALGRLYYRTSYGQNVLNHSKEVAKICGMIAAELGVDRDIARRSGLLHDVGKSIEADGESNHAELGAELAKRMGEDKLVVNAILAHHNDVEPESIYAIIVQIADAISGVRPGARRESVDDYIKRLENLEKISTSFEGVEKAFAIQAGRELRVIIDSNKIDDAEVKDIAKGIAKRIETEMKYPGRIKITMIRETRVVEYAR